MSSISVVVRHPKIFSVNSTLPETEVLDVGCGLGGAARFVASRYGCHVTGIDLTPEFIETAKVICGWVNLDSHISLHQGSALAMPFADRAFDRAYMLHVGMNIDDKAKALLGGQPRPATELAFRHL
jgi:ubiquinone/menaquinone biosynthesis C-methylase UbiE